MIASVDGTLNQVITTTGSTYAHNVGELVAETVAAFHAPAAEHEILYRFEFPERPGALMRFLDALYGLPYLPFAIITLAIFGGASFWTMVVALSVASWFTTARIVRGQVITLKENDYVRAAKAVGARWYRVLGRHVLPNTLGVLIIAIFLELPGVILGEAFLSFIGLGISPPDASWGSMAQDGYRAYRVSPHIIVVPSVAIASLILCANFVADGLRDAFDPRTKET